MICVIGNLFYGTINKCFWSPFHIKLTCSHSVIIQCVVSAILDFSIDI